MPAELASPALNRILVVDDNPAIHDDFRKILCGTHGRDGGLDAAEADLFGSGADSNPSGGPTATTSLQIDSAHQGAEALEMVQRSLSSQAPYSLVFLDIRMPPGWDGIETAHRLWQADPRLQIVLCSAYSDYSWDDMIRQLGQSDRLVILKKPFENIEVLQLAHALSEKWRLHRTVDRQLENLQDEVRLRTLELTQQKFAVDQHSIVAVTDVQGRITYVNDRLCVISQFSREELLGQDHRMLNSGHHPKEFSQELYQTIGRGIVWHGEVKNRARDGSHYWVATTIVPLKGTDGKPVSYIAICSDITAIKQAGADLIVARDAAESANQALVESNEQLETAIRRAQQLAICAESANQAKSEFLATMSHEIRTPMNGVIGFTNLLLDTPLTEEQQEFAGTIKNSGEALLGLINDILDYSKIEAGKLTVENIPYDLEHAVSEVADLLAPRAHEKGVELAVRYAPGVARELVGDPGRVRQVLLNLLGNAFKFTERGHVLIEVAELAPASGLRITVSDTGIGIPKDKQAQLFQHFSQADSTTTRRFGGTGLGLAISKRLVELMGGAVGLDSEPGGGSTFWFTLPAAAAAVAPTEPDPANLAGARVLVVDDLEINRRLLHEQLKAWSVDHECASSGVEALEKLRAASAAGRPFHVAVLDYLMPEMDGKELGRLIRGDAALSGTALVVLTSGSQRSEAKRFLEAGFAAFLLKPLIRPTLLRDALATALRACPGGSPAPNGSAPVPARAPAAPPLSEPAKAGFLRVLLAEDNATNQLLATHLLKKMGCRVDMAANGKEAVALAQQLPYDLIFMDCHMPEMDGFEATREIRRREAEGAETPRLAAGRRGLRVPILAVTASVMESDRLACAAAGMDDFITKPIRSSDLREALKKWCGDGLKGDAN